MHPRRWARRWHENETATRQTGTLMCHSDITHTHIYIFPLCSHSTHKGAPHNRGTRGDHRAADIVVYTLIRHTGSATMGFFMACVNKSCALFHTHTNRSWVSGLGSLPCFPWYPLWSGVRSSLPSMIKTIKRVGEFWGSCCRSVWQSQCELRMPRFVPADYERAVCFPDDI